MASTTSQKEIDESVDKEVQADDTVVGEQTPETIMINELEKHYGVQLADDSEDAKKKFIHDCVKESHRIAKERPSDPIKEAKFDEKLGNLRNLWSVDEEKEETSQQTELRDKLKEQGINIGLTFPDDDTYRFSTGGNEDTGSMSAGIEAIVGIADRMTNPQAY